MLSKNYVNVLLLGISGMDYKITKGLLAAGRLPSFKKLADQGSFIKLDASLPAENNLAWISLLTGLNPGKHNCFDAVNRNPLTYGLELVSVKNNNEAFRNKLIDQLISHAGLSASAPGLSFLDHFDSEGNNPGGQELIKQIADLEKTQEDWFWKEFFQFKEKGLMYFIFNALNQLQQTFWNNPAIGREEGKINLNIMKKEDERRTGRGPTRWKIFENNDKKKAVKVKKRLVRKKPPKEKMIRKLSSLYR